MVRLLPAALFAGLAVLVAVSPSTRWGLVQLIKSVWILPASTLPTSLLSRVEKDAWVHWEATRPGTRRDPLPLPELRADDVAAGIDLSRPLLARGLLSKELARGDRQWHGSRHWLAGWLAATGDGMDDGTRLREK